MEKLVVKIIFWSKSNLFVIRFLFIYFLWQFLRLLESKRVYIRALFFLITQYTAIFNGCKNDDYQMKNCDSFLFLLET